MGTITPITKAIERRSWKQVKSFFETMGDQAGDLISDYQQLMLDDPCRAIRDLPRFLDEIRMACGKGRGAESLAGGPMPEFTTPLLNIVGAVYPGLERGPRTEGLLRCLDYLDRINCLYSQNHVERIDEPWLVGDIIINRPMYWCGYERYATLADKAQSWAEFSPIIEEARSEFWLAMAVTRPKHASLEVRTRFNQQYPELMDRTLDALAGIVYEESKRCCKGNSALLQADIAESMSMYDIALHEAIHRKMGERKWINLES